MAASNKKFRTKAVFNDVQSMWDMLSLEELELLAQVYQDGQNIRRPEGYVDYIYTDPFDYEDISYFCDNNIFYASFEEYVKEEIFHTREFWNGYNRLSD